MATINFYPMTVDYRAHEDYTEVRIYGRRTDGRQICVVDKTFPPHFYVILKDMTTLHEFGKKMQSLKLRSKKKEIKVVRLEVFSKRHGRKNRDVVRVILETPFDIYPISETIRDWPEIEEVLETDISYTKKYILERKITPMMLMEAEGEYEQRHFKVPVFSARKIREVTGEMILPKTLFFDVKTADAKKATNEEQPFLAISFFGENYSKTITWKRFETNDPSIEFVESEADLIKRFQHVLEEYSPDMLIGFLSEKFDMPHLSKRAQKYKLHLELGLDYSQFIFTKKTKISGISYLDLADIVKKVFSRRSEYEFEDIDKIAKEILSDETFQQENENLPDMFRRAKEELKIYSKIFEKFFPFILELSKLMNLTIEETINLNPFSMAEWYVFKNAIQKNLLIPNRVEETQAKLIEEERFTVEPQERVHKNIFSLDMRNMAAALTAKYNISPDAMRCADCKGLTHDDPWFCKTKKGMLPELLDDLISRKTRIKDILSGTDESKKTLPLISRFEAIGILVHSFSRYIGSTKARFYSQECDDVLKRLEDDTRRKIVKKVQEKGFKIIYFDRDFIFLGLNNRRKEDAYVISAILNELFFADTDVEGIFKSGFFLVNKKGKRFIKYALLLPDKTIRTKNFELVQRNVGNIAKHAQEKALKLVLEKGDATNALRYLQEIVQKLRNKEIENKDITLSNELQKDVLAYETNWPYIAVAKKLIEQGNPIGKGSVIEYIVEQGKEKASDRAKIPEEVEEKNYDAEYYINTQLVPSVIDIFEAFGFTRESLVEVKEQLKLNNFFK